MFTTAMIRSFSRMEKMTLYFPTLNLFIPFKGPRRGFASGCCRGFSYVDSTANSALMLSLVDFLSLARCFSDFDDTLIVQFREIFSTTCFYLLYTFRAFL